MDKEKKRIRVIGINRGRDMALYAKKIEKAINELTEEGYEVSPHEQRNGMLLMGTLRSPSSLPADHPLARLLNNAARIDMDESPPWSPKTVAIVGRFANVVRDEGSFVKDTTKYAHECVKGYSMNDLEEVKGEIAKALEEHNKVCDSGDRRALFWTAVIGALTQVMQQNLQ
jgi:hypothetical protein